MNSRIVMGAVAALTLIAAAVVAQPVTSTSVTRFQYKSGTGSIPPEVAQRMSELKQTPDSFLKSSGLPEGKGESTDSSTRTTSGTTPLTRMYKLDVTLCSSLPGKGIDAVEQGSGGTITGKRGELRLPMHGASGKFAVGVQMNGKETGLSVKLSVTPASGDNTEPKQLECDLSSMQAASVEIARDADGRVYFANLMPRIQKTGVEAPKNIDAEAAKLHTMQFVGSPITIDGTSLVGEMTGSGFEYAYVDLAGEMRVEFALVPMEGAQPMGKLRDGRITIRNADGRTLEVFNVASMYTGQQITGGPYIVYARWLPPTETKEQAQAKLEKLLTAQEASVPADAAERVKGIIKKAKAGVPVMSSHGGGGLPRAKTGQ